MRVAVWNELVCRWLYEGDSVATKVGSGSSEFRDDSVDDHLGSTNCEIDAGHTHATVGSRAWYPFFLLRKA